MAKKIPLTGLLPNSSYSISIRGKSDSGLYTPWSKFNTFTTVGDNTAPSTPSAPTVIVTTQPQTVRVRHDGTKSAGGNLESDISHYEVYVNDTNSNAGGTQVGTIPAVRPGAGIYSEGNITINAPSPTNTKYFYVKVVDISGNRSSASPTATASSIPYFSDAYISNLSADKITTGTLQANESINVGTTTPIVLKSNSTSPKGQIYIGTGTYANANTPFYVASDNKFSLGSNLSWDGSSLSITGAITATSGSFTGTVNASDGVFTGYVSAGTSKFGVGAFTVSSVAYDGLSIDSTNFWGVKTGTVQFQVGNATNYIQWNQSSSLLSIKGNIEATGGSFENYMTAGPSIYIGQNITIATTIGSITSDTYKGFLLDAESGKGYNFWAINAAGKVKFQVGNNTNYLKWNEATTTLEVKGNVVGSTITASTLQYETTDSLASIGLNAASAGLEQGFYIKRKAVGGVEASFTVDTSGANNAAWIESTKGLRMRAGVGSAGVLYLQGSSGITLDSQTNTSYTGLDASVKNITISTSNPTGGNVGEVWLKYIA